MEPKEMVEALSVQESVALLYLFFSKEES